MKQETLKITFYEPDYRPDSPVIYSVIAARYSGDWIFVRHCGNKTWEMPAGHVEDFETPEEAAGRELAEETGAEEFELQCVATYSVEKEGTEGYGRLYYAEITSMGPVQDKEEVDELLFSRNMPAALTYPDIQPALFSRVFRYIQKLSS